MNLFFINLFVNREIWWNVSLSLGKSYCSINCNITHRNINVDKEVLLIEISLLVLSGGYFFHPSKFDNFRDEKNSDYKTVSVAQKLAGQKTVGLLGLWATFEGRFFMFFGAKIFLKFSFEILHKMKSNKIIF